MSDAKIDSSDLTAWISIPICIVVGLSFAAAIGGGGFDASDVRVAVWPVALAFVIQWVAFVPAFVMRTEHFYDLVGGLTFISVAILALVLAPVRELPELLLFFAVTIWASRLSLFLFRRVRREKSDRRFDAIKQSLPRFLFAWTAQGLWVTFSLAPVLAVMASTKQVSPTWLFWLGIGLWVLGFGIEVVADWQKERFRAQSENKGQFIRSGLWSLSRHPNYFGEVLLWVGISLAALPAISGWQYFCLSSPFFVFALLRFISGVPMLEKSADARWGDREDYRRYKEETPMLFPRLR